MLVSLVDLEEGREQYAWQKDLIYPKKKRTSLRGMTSVMTKETSGTGRQESSQKVIR